MSPSETGDVGRVLITTKNSRSSQRLSSFPECSSRDQECLQILLYRGKVYQGSLSYSREYFDGKHRSRSNDASSREPFIAVVPHSSRMVGVSLSLPRSMLIWPSFKVTQTM